jgi:hypothetical protein
VITAVAAIACLLAIAGCGSSKPRHPAAKESPTVAFARCMRAHGEYPGSGTVATVNSQSPAFQAAQTACLKLLPGAALPYQKASAQEIKQALEASICMRAHGVTGFPDPVMAKRPPPALGIFSMIQFRGGILLEVPKSIDTASPAFGRAAKTCNLNG